MIHDPILRMLRTSVRAALLTTRRIIAVGIANALDIAWSTSCFASVADRYRNRRANLDLTFEKKRYRNCHSAMYALTTNHGS